MRMLACCLDDAAGKSANPPSYVLSLLTRGCIQGLAAWNEVGLLGKFRRCSASNVGLAHGENLSVAGQDVHTQSSQGTPPPRPAGARWGACVAISPVDLPAL